LESKSGAVSTSDGWRLNEAPHLPWDAVDYEWIEVYLFVEPGSTAGNYRYRVALTRAGNVRCPDMRNQLPMLGESLEMEDDAADDCAQPPRVSPGEIEPWAKTPIGTKTLSLSGSMDCSGDGYSTQESATLTLTMVSCNGAPCLWQ
jgi:hypothetical protein